MNRKHLIKYLESIVYPLYSHSAIVRYTDEDGVIIALSLKGIQKEFEKMLADLPQE